MKAARALAIVLAAVTLLGCRTAGEGDTPPSTPATPTSREVRLAPGESARVDDLTLTFEGVSADSRCPIGVQCFWEGDAVVTVKASQPSREPAALELHTAGRFPREGTYGRYRVRLESLTPQPREGEAVPAGDYRAVLVVTSE
jgi:hypothetical protein